VGEYKRARKKKNCRKERRSRERERKNKIKKTHLGLLLELWYEWNGQAF
jgi:hypothetical protein